MRIHRPNTAPARDASRALSRRRLRLPFLAASLLCARCGDPASMAPDAPPPVPPSPVDKPAAYVDPFIGSGGFGFRNGSALPGALAPHGLAKVGPDTRGPFGTVNFLHYSGYWYGDDVIQSFTHLHLQGTGATDYGVLAFMPVASWTPARTGPDGPDGYESPFQKTSEQATPGYYAVTLDRGGIRVEITATARAAHHRYTFPAATTDAAVIVDLNKHLSDGRIDAAEVHLDAATGTLRGKLHSLGGMTDGYGGYDVYFVARASRPFREAQVWSAGSPPQAGTDATGTGVGCVLRFARDTPPTADGTSRVELQIGLSLVSEAGAAANLAAELPAWDFDGTRARTESAWTTLLSAARVFGGSDAERRTFYSSLYRTYHMPTVHSDGDGSYLGFDRKVHSAAGYRYVSDLSLWDTYRTVSPLYALLAPDTALDVVRSLIAMADASGRYPKWPLAGGDSGTMIGASAEIVLSDAHLRGVTDFDVTIAYATLRKAALDPTPPPAGRGGRDDIELYMQHGYVPTHIGGSVSRTTEFARNDFSLAQLARAAGQTADADALERRARENYRTLYDAKTGFLRGRTDKGDFRIQNFEPSRYTEDYVEANAWQSLWMTDFDVPGLVTLLGGTDKFVAQLSDMFERSKAETDAEDPANAGLGADRPGFYWHGNEPDINAPYLFALAGRADLTQRWVRWAMDAHYRDQPAGLAGNDDGGTLSAWYVLSALGLYPVMGTDRYVLTTPRFPRAELRVAGGTFTIEVDDTALVAKAGASAPRIYVAGATLDGVPLPGPELRHADIRAGRVLRFTARAEPTAWGAP